jgi:hypothetical protein
MNQKRKTAIYDLEINQGADWVFEFIMSTQDGDEAPRVPIDLTDHDFILSIRKTQKSPVALVTLSTFNGKITRDENGRVRCALPGEITADLVAGPARYDVKVIRSGVEIARPLEGRVTIFPENSKYVP